MKKVTKVRRAMCLLLVLAMVLGLVPGAGMKAEAADFEDLVEIVDLENLEDLEDIEDIEEIADLATNYDLWVAGVQVNSENCGNVLDDDKVSYDPTNNVLTLKNFDYEGSGGGPVTDKDKGVIVYKGEQPLTITLIGDTNNIRNTYEGSEYSGHGIVCYSDLTINGDISLSTPNGYGIWTNGDLTFEDGLIRVESAVIGIKVIGGDLTALSGIITVAPEGEASTIVGDTGIAVENGSILVDGPEFGTANYKKGITVENGNITLKDGKLLVNGSDDGISISGSSDNTGFVSIYGGEFASYSKTDIGISGSSSKYVLIEEGEVDVLIAGYKSALSGIKVLNKVTGAVWDNFAQEGKGAHLSANTVPVSVEGKVLIFPSLFRYL